MHSRCGLLIVLLSTCSASAQSLTPAFGVNEAGLEMGTGSVAFSDYAVPDPGYMLRQGVGIVRVPFTLERLQPVPFGRLDSSYLSYIDSIIAEDTAAHVLTVLDIHNYGYISVDGTSREIGVDPVGTAEYINILTRLANSLRGKPLVALGLMNEPHSQTCAELTPVWQSAINAIRNIGFDGTVTVPPTNWSHADTFVSSGCADLFAGLKDPNNNFVVELHNYLDPNESGTYEEPVASPIVGTQQLETAVAWANKNSIKLYIGETGTPADAENLAALRNELDTIASAPTTFWGVTLWAASPWWPISYNLRLDPINGVPQPQISLLKEFTAPPAALIIDLKNTSSTFRMPYSVYFDGNFIGTETASIVALTGQFGVGHHTTTITLQSITGASDTSAPQTLYSVVGKFNGHVLGMSSRNLSYASPTTTIEFTKY